ncbi:glycosyltransferase family 1 protein [Acidobacteria bacterium AB60]|nr:glycosyltransferase family 1 protein [Acidobacteria bacterium AB60]
MRVALFTETFVPKIDGIVTTLCETIRQLRVLGHDVLVVAPDGGLREFQDSAIAGMKAWSFPLYPELRLALPRASLRNVIRDFAPDLIHVADPALLGIAGLYYSGGKDGGALRLPLVISYHTDLPAYLRYYKLGFLEPYIWKILRLRHKRASVNLCTSQAMAEQLRSHGVERVALWPGGVDTARFCPGRLSATMRDRLTGGNPGSPLLLYVGRLSPEKNLESLKPMLQELPGARLALVGDGPHRRQLEAHFKGLPVVMAGFLRGVELAEAYASADIFVMPSRTETLGLVVLEAMSSGLPVVAARAGGIPEMIDDGVSGRLYEDEGEAVSLLRSLMASSELRSRIGAAARIHAARQSWGHATSILLEHYKDACATQHIAGPEVVPAPRPLLGRVARRSTMYAIRKMLP